MGEVERGQIMSCICFLLKYLAIEGGQDEENHGKHQSRSQYKSMEKLRMNAVQVSKQLCDIKSKARNELMFWILPNTGSNFFSGLCGKNYVGGDCPYNLFLFSGSSATYESDRGPIMREEQSWNLAC